MKRKLSIAVILSVIALNIILVKTYIYESPDRYFRLGHELISREKITEDQIDQAIFYLRKAAQKGHVVAYYDLSIINRIIGEELPKDIENAYQISDLMVASYNWMLQSANGGYAPAQTALGMMYTEGYGSVAQDANQAFYWYQQAANQGHAEAEYLLACAYYEGQGVAKNEQEAVKWMEKAAKKNYLKAQFHLGVIYSLGADNVPKNIEKAYQLLSKAADCGDADIQYKLGCLCVYKNSPFHVGKTYEWWIRAAQRQHPQAQLGLFKLYYNGIGVPKDITKSYMWLLIAAKNGEAQAQEMLPSLAVQLSKKQIKKAEIRANEWLNQYLLKK